MMAINPRIKRMDSMMIAANIRKLSRTELHYTCVAKLVIYLHKSNQDILIKGLERYYDSNDYNKTFYYNNESETDALLKTILEDADKLLSVCGSDYDDITEYQLLVRCLSEQQWSRNSTTHVEKTVPCRQNACQRSDTWKIFLWLQNRSIEF